MDSCKDKYLYEHTYEVCQDDKISAVGFCNSLSPLRIGRRNQSTCVASAVGQPAISNVAAYSPQVPSKRLLLVQVK